MHLSPPPTLVRIVKKTYGGGGFPLYDLLYSGTTSAANGFAGKAVLKLVHEQLTEKHFLQVVDETIQEVLGPKS